jgi:hypothetical protein
MSGRGDKLPYAKKITLRLTQDDVDFINRFADEHEVSQQNATRMLLYLSRCNIEILKDKANFFIIR